MGDQYYSILTRKEIKVSSNQGIFFSFRGLSAESKLGTLISPQIRKNMKIFLDSPFKGTVQ
jgi:hypothetical protein